LDRSKINKEKTGGTIHHLALTLSTPSTPTRLTNIDDTTPFAMPSTTTNTPVTISTTSRVSTPRYSNKQIKTNNLLSELNSIIQVNCSILSSNISESVLAVINKAKARPERASFTLTGHCLTSDIAISQMEEREKEQEERLTQLIEKKTEREAKAKEVQVQALEKRKRKADEAAIKANPKSKKKRVTKSDLTTVVNDEVIEDSLPDSLLSETQYIPSNQPARSCQTVDCLAIFETDRYQNEWYSCDDCKRWYCSFCVTMSNNSLAVFDGDAFICKDC